MTHYHVLSSNTNDYPVDGNGPYDKPGDAMDALRFWKKHYGLLGGAIYIQGCDDNECYPPPQNRIAHEATTS